MTTVSLFNATPDEIVVQINGGPQLHVPGTSETSNWVAQQPEEVVQWSEYQSLPGQIGYMGAPILIQGASSTADPNKISRVQIPPFSGGDKVNSIQFYVFLAGEGYFSALLLKDGHTIYRSSLLTHDYPG